MCIRDRYRRRAALCSSTARRRPALSDHLCGSVVVLFGSLAVSAGVTDEDMELVGIGQQVEHGPYVLACSGDITRVIGAGGSDLGEPLANLFLNGAGQEGDEPGGVVVLDRPLGAGNNRSLVESSGLDPGIGLAFASTVQPHGGLEEPLVRQQERVGALVAHSHGPPEGFTEFRFSVLGGPGKDELDVACGQGLSGGLDDRSVHCVTMWRHRNHLLCRVVIGDMCDTTRPGRCPSGAVSSLKGTSSSFGDRRALRSADAVPVAAVQVVLENLSVFCASDACAGLTRKIEIAGRLGLVACQSTCPGDGLAGVGEVERRHLTRRGLRAVSYTHLTLPTIY